MSTQRTLASAGLALAIFATLGVNDARAGNFRGRLFSANATSFCQSALPVFDGNVRKRPLAVQNEGAANAFVTCSFTAQATGLIEVAVFAVNNNNVPVAATCTAVTGTALLTANMYNVRMFTIPAFGISGVGWVTEDFGGGTGSTIPGSGLFNLSCSLPPGVGLSRAQVELHEGVGA